jgi:hypothetical protein
MRGSSAFWPLALAGALASSACASQRIGSSLRVGGGPSFPLGELGEEVATGFHVTGSTGLFGLGMPVELRVDGVFESFTEEDDGGWRRRAGALANVMKPVPRRSSATYLIGGLGAFRMEDQHEAEGPATDFTFGVGGGMALGRLFLELRYVDSGARMRSIPVTFGFRFR